MNCSSAGRNLQSCKTRKDPAFCSDNGRRLERCRRRYQEEAIEEIEDGGGEDEDPEDEDEDPEVIEIEFEPDDVQNLQNYMDYVRNWRVGEEFEPPNIAEPAVCVFNGVDPEPIACMPTRAILPPVRPTWLDIVSRLRDDYNGPNYDDNAVGLCTGEMWPLAPRR